MGTNNSIRLRTEPGSSKNINVKIQQEFDTIDFLSLKITQDQAYQNFCSDYGVIAGRVIANDGFGVENAKISVFIPLSDEDAEDPIISQIYPYSTPTDKNGEGIRYNLLPALGKEFTLAIKIPNDTLGNYQSPDDYLSNPGTTALGTFPATNAAGNTNNWILVENNPGIGNFSIWSRDVFRQNAPAVPVGTFPEKFEILDNDSLLEVYDKYYKYTTKTNASGDYMLFGVPLGTKIVHMDVDLSDTGAVSLTVDDFTNLGFPVQQFDGNKFKSSTNLDSLTQIEAQNLTVDVIPFWGNTEQCEIGISRLDFNLTKTIVPSSILFFQAFTNTGGRFLKRNSSQCGSGGPGNVNDDELRSILYKVRMNVSVEAIDENGNEIPPLNFPGGNVIFPLPMYEDRKITDEFGNLVDSPDGIKGIPTGGSYQITTFNPDENLTIIPSSEEEGIAQYSIPQDPTKFIKYRYDLKNRKRLLYTVGWLCQVEKGSGTNDSTLALSDGAVGSNYNTFPRVYQTSSDNRFGKGDGFNNAPIVYGSLYHPRIQVKDANTPCCTKVANSTSAFAPNGGRWIYKNQYQVAGVLDVTDILPFFQVYGGNFNASSAENFIFSNAVTPSSSSINIAGETFPFRSQSGGVLIPPVSNSDFSVEFDDRLNIESTEDLDKVITIVNSVDNLESGEKSEQGWYFFYFGLEKNNTSLHYLKDNLSV